MSIKRYRLGFENYNSSFLLKDDLARKIVQFSLEAHRADCIISRASVIENAYFLEMYWGCKKRTGKFVKLSAKWCIALCGWRKLHLMLDKTPKREGFEIWRSLWVPKISFLLELNHNDRTTSKHKTSKEKTASCANGVWQIYLNKKTVTPQRDTVKAA